MDVIRLIYGLRLSGLLFHVNSIRHMTDVNKK